jgi:hypothetical protein
VRQAPLDKDLLVVHHKLAYHMLVAVAVVLVV